MSENTDIKTRLKQLRQGRPWQLLMIGEGTSQITAEDVDALTRIFDLFPHVGGLDVATSAGPVRVSRDFPSDYTSRVDQLLAGIFERNPAVTGITFPAVSGRAGHTATPADPHWSAQGQAIEGLSEARRRGEITGDETVMPSLRGDAEAEQFVAQADLSKYDLTDFKPMRFVIAPKTAE